MLKIGFSISAVVLVVGIFLIMRAKQPVSVFSNQSSHTSVAAPSVVTGDGSDQSTPNAAGSVAQTPSGQVAGAKTDFLLYRNTAFDFDLSYPKEWGEAVVQENTPATSGVCMKKGKQLYGVFSNNAGIDFALATPDFVPCPNTKNPLFAVKSMKVAGDKLTLSFGDFRTSETVPIEATIATATQDISAYIFKNFIDANSQGELAAVVTSPHPSTLGHPVFRTHGLGMAEAKQLLKELIAP